MNPGVRNFPLPSITRAPAGTLTEARGPAATILPPTTTTTASGTGVPPFPSISVAPTIAIVESAATDEREALGRSARAITKSREVIVGLEVEGVLLNAATGTRRRGECCRMGWPSATSVVLPLLSPSRAPWLKQIEGPVVR